MNTLKKYLNLSWVLKRALDRISGREARRLFQNNLELARRLEDVELEIQKTKSEMVELQAQNSSYLSRESRLHNYVKEALMLVRGPEKYSTNQAYSNPAGRFVGLFKKYGSDKEDRHNYAEVYSSLLAEIETPNILEIGLGSINDYPYAGLPPGGSIQAWRAGAPNAVIVGADIDPAAVAAVSETGFVIDQTSDESLNQFVQNVAEYVPFDLIVDDGFHDPHANMRTLLRLLPLLSVRGAYVIEDVHESLLDLWVVMSRSIDAQFEVVDLRADRPGVDDNILLIFRKK